MLTKSKNRISRSGLNTYGAEFYYFFAMKQKSSCMEASYIIVLTQSCEKMAFQLYILALQ